MVEGRNEVISPEQAFAAIGFSFDALENLPTDGLRMPNPLVTADLGIVSFLANARDKERFAFDEEWMEFYQDLSEGYDDSNIWQVYSDYPEGREHMQTFLADELPYLLAQQGIRVNVAFEEEEIEGKPVSSMVVKSKG